jgi:hypothetical protein
MDARNIQPQRKDIFINTSWGIPENNISKKEARRKGLKFFKGYWVTKEEKKQLMPEYNAYHSLYLLSRFLVLFSIFMLLMSFSFPPLSLLISTSAALALFVGSIGLFQYQQWARIISTVALVSIFFIPFIPNGLSDKGAPVFWWPISLISLYVLHNKTARKIFSKPKTGHV